MSDEINDAVPEPKSFPGEIVEVSGRRAAGGSRGEQALTRMVLSTDNGENLEFGAGGSSSGEKRRMTVLAVIPSGTFGSPDPICPICLGPADSDEHVPQSKLGGEIMTATCLACNNGLGSRAESELQLWFDGMLAHVFIDYDGPIPGRRRVSNMHLLEHTSEDGKPSFGLFADGDVPDDVRAMINSGEFRFSFQELDERRWRAALLKHAYLAACLQLGYVPDTPECDEIRACLLSVRDGDLRTRPAENDLANNLHVQRSGAGKQGPHLALTADLSKVAEEGESSRFYISLAGVLFVSWPLEESLPGRFEVTRDDGE